MALDTQAAPIELDESLLISRGSTRATYRHPLRSDRCIKVIYAEKTRRSRIAPWRRVPVPNANKRELEGFEEVRKKLGHLTEFISSVYGVVQTSLGEGLEVECVVPVGAEMFSLKALLKRGLRYLPEDADIRSVISQYQIVSDEILRANLANHCTSRESIVFVRHNGGYRLRIIDYKILIYTKFIPIGRKFFRRKYLARQIASNLSRLEKIAAERRSLSRAG